MYKGTDSPFPFQAEYLFGFRLEYASSFPHRRRPYDLRPTTYDPIFQVRLVASQARSVRLCQPASVDASPQSPRYVIFPRRITMKRVFPIFLLSESNPTASDTAVYSITT